MNRAHTHTTIGAGGLGPRMRAPRRRDHVASTSRDYPHLETVVRACTVDPKQSACSPHATVR